MGDECDRLLRYFPGLEVGGPTWAASRRVVMDKHDNGDWVRYEDARTRIATLESQLAASEAKCAELELECENAYVKIVDEREAYGSQLAAALTRVEELERIQNDLLIAAGIDQDERDKLTTRAEEAERLAESQRRRAEEAIIFIRGQSGQGLKFVESALRQAEAKGR